MIALHRIVAVFSSISAGLLFVAIAVGQSKGVPVAPPNAAGAIATAAVVKSHNLKPSAIERALGQRAVADAGVTTIAVLSMNDGNAVACGDRITFRARVTGGTRTPGTQVIAFGRVTPANRNALAFGFSDLARRLLAGDLTQDEVSGTVFVAAGETKEVVFPTEWRACTSVSLDSLTAGANRDAYYAMLFPAAPPGELPAARLYGFGVSALTFRALPVTPTSP